ncbi:MAG: hypothetical protein ACI4XE_00695 [Acutalibacteraceae bacterium]
MKYAVLALVVAAVFLLGFFIMKKTDAALENNQRKMKEISGQSSLRIAFENPMTAEEIIPVVESVCKKYPECEVYFFCSAAENIKKSLSQGNLDFGFLTDGSSEVDETMKTFRFFVVKSKLLCPCVGSPIEPLEPGSMACTAIWKKDDTGIYVKTLSEKLVKSFESSAHEC